MFMAISTNTLVSLPAVQQGLHYSGTITLILIKCLAWSLGSRWTFLPSMLTVFRLLTLNSEEELWCSSSSSAQLVQHKSNTPLYSELRHIPQLPGDSPTLRKTPRHPPHHTAPWGSITYVQWSHNKRQKYRCWNPSLKTKRVSSCYFKIARQKYCLRIDSVVDWPTKLDGINIKGTHQGCLIHRKLNGKTRMSALQAWYS